MNKKTPCIQVNRIVISQAVRLLFCCIAVVVVPRYFCEKHFCRGVSPPKSVIVESGATLTIELKRKKYFDFFIKRKLLLFSASYLKKKKLSLKLQIQVIYALCF